MASSLAEDPFVTLARYDVVLNNRVVLITSSFLDKGLLPLERIYRIWSPLLFEFGDIGCAVIACTL